MDFLGCGFLVAGFRFLVFTNPKFSSCLPRRPESFREAGERSPPERLIRSVGRGVPDRREVEVVDLSFFRTYTLCKNNFPKG